MAFDIKYKDKSKSSIYVPEIARINKIQQISPTEKYRYCFKMIKIKII